MTPMIKTTTVTFMHTSVVNISGNSIVWYATF